MQEIQNLFDVLVFGPLSQSGLWNHAICACGHGMDGIHWRTLHFEAYLTGGRWYTPGQPWRVADVKRFKGIAPYYTWPWNRSVSRVLAVFRDSLFWRSLDEYTYFVARLL